MSKIEISVEILIIFIVIWKDKMFQICTCVNIWKLINTSIYQNHTTQTFNEVIEVHL